MTFQSQSFQRRAFYDNLPKLIINWLSARLFDSDQKLTWSSGPEPGTYLANDSFHLSSETGGEFVKYIFIQYL